MLQASGYILDIDNQEEFTIHARDENEVDVAAPLVLTPSSGSGGNGDASFWAFDVGQPIHSIRIDFTGGGSSKGIAFDQFSPASACPGQVLHHGNGIPGSGGRVPAISISCPAVGSAGTVELFNGASGVHGYLLPSLTGAVQPYRCASTVLSNPSVVLAHRLSGSGGVPGQGQKSIPFGPVPASMAGVKVHLQAGYCDPGAPCGELATTEVLEVTVR